MLIKVVGDNAEINKESVTGVEQKECAVEKLQHIGIGLEMDVMAHLVEITSTYVFSSHEVSNSVGTLLGNTRLEKTRRFLEGRVLARNYSKRKIANSTRSYSSSNRRVMPG